MDAFWKAWRVRAAYYYILTLGVGFLVSNSFGSYTGAYYFMAINLFFGYTLLGMFKIIHRSNKWNLIKEAALNGCFIFLTAAMYFMLFGSDQALFVGKWMIYSLFTGSWAGYLFQGKIIKG